MTEKKNDHWEDLVSLGCNWGPLIIKPRLCRGNIFFLLTFGSTITLALPLNITSYTTSNAAHHSIRTVRHVDKTQRSASIWDGTTWWRYFMVNALLHWRMSDSKWTIYIWQLLSQIHFWPSVLSTSVMLRRALSYSFQIFLCICQSHTPWTLAWFLLPAL